jgi:hypothetical protein
MGYVGREWAQLAHDREHYLGLVPTNNVEPSVF